MPVKFFTLFPCLNLPLYRQPNRKSSAFVFTLGEDINCALMEFNNILGNIEAKAGRIDIQCSAASAS